MQLPRSLILEVRLAPHGSAIHWHFAAVQECPFVGRLSSLPLLRQALDARPRWAKRSLASTRRGDGLGATHVRGPDHEDPV